MERYTKTAIALHWLIALLIVAAFILGLVMTDIPGLTPTKLKYYSWHKWMGVTVLALAAGRLLWRLKEQPPELPASMTQSQKKAAEAGHWFLYFLMFAVPISGYLYTTAAGVPVVYLGLLKIPSLFDASPALKEILKPVHYWLNMLLAAVVIGHIAAALKHHFIDKDGLLKRMLP
ncbi:cytochrome b [Pseudoduganella eburnea]|uniref:Cytochrome b n=1 Tax=Massilia eburnea TaxID=1776165 RepID=A0A6L6QJ17_9BURK|nr:cytochrome b [Massilia eburnea]MTW12372.1 cytochrome b [Massilia eburnea]